MKTKKVRVLRSFYHARKLIEEGKVVELPLTLAHEVIASNKAEAIGGDNDDEPEGDYRQHGLGHDTAPDVTHGKGHETGHGKGHETGKK